LFELAGIEAASMGYEGDGVAGQQRRRRLPQMFRQRPALRLRSAPVFKLLAYGSDFRRQGFGQGHIVSPRKTFCRRHATLTVSLFHAPLPKAYNVTKAETVLVAEIVEVMPEIGLWSGYVAALQQVRYKVIETLKGQLSTDTAIVTVGHYIVKNSPTADNQVARLSPRTFQKGKRLILFLVSDNRQPEDVIEKNKLPNNYISFNEKCGALPANKKTTQQVRQLLR
jgi:hypothetical protein